MKSWKKKGAFLLALAVMIASLPVMPARKVQAATGKYVVVLDPGHGGGETGAWGKHGGVTYKEEEINWKITQYTKQALSAYDNIQVYVTRTQNQRLSISGRVSMASLYNPDLLVSQHINSASSSSAHGASVMISKGTYRPKLHQAEKKFGTYVMNELGKLGIYKRFPETGGMEYRMTENNSKYPNGQPRDYYGIVAQSVEHNFPGVIIEHAFISNYSDVMNFLSTDAKLKKLGQADARAIVKYFSTAGDVPVVTSPGWEKIGSDWYYRKADGTYAKGWLNLNNKKYYLKPSGARAVGWKKLGAWRYFNSDGVMQTGWLAEGKYRFYLDSNGKRLEGLYKINSKIYYFAPKADGTYRQGARVSGWHKVGGYYYYFTYQGAKTGWNKIGGNWYYMTKTGKMKTGWLELNGKHYYMYSMKNTKRGQRLSNTTATIKGKKYHFNANGVCTNYH